MKVPVRIIFDGYIETASAKKVSKQTRFRHISIFCFKVPMVVVICIQCMIALHSLKFRKNEEFLFQSGLFRLYRDVSGKRTSKNSQTIKPMHLHKIQTKYEVKGLCVFGLCHFYRDVIHKTSCNERFSIVCCNVAMSNIETSSVNKLQK